MRLSSGGHAHPRLVLHEPEAPAALHQAGHEEVPQGDRPRGTGPRPDPHGGLRQHEPHRLRPERRHAGHARCTAGGSIPMMKDVIYHSLLESSV